MTDERVEHACCRKRTPIEEAYLDLAGPRPREVEDPGQHEYVHSRYTPANVCGECGHHINDRVHAVIYHSTEEFLESLGATRKCSREGCEEDPSLHFHTDGSEYDDPAVRVEVEAMFDESPRAALLDEAKGLVTGERNNQYGEPHQDFKRTAEALTAMGYRGPGGRELKAHDVAILVGMVKISRLMWQPDKRDSWVDWAGYAACGWDCVVEEQK